MSNHAFSTPFFHDCVFNVLEIMHVIKWDVNWNEQHKHNDQSALKNCVLDDSSNSLYPAFLIKTFCKTNLHKAGEIYEFIKTVAIKWRLNACWRY